MTLMKTSFDRNFVIQDMTATLPSSGRWSGSSRTCIMVSSSQPSGMHLASCRDCKCPCLIPSRLHA